MMDFEKNKEKILFFIGYLMVLLKFTVESSTLMNFDFIYYGASYVSGEITVVTLAILSLFKIYYSWDLIVKNLSVSNIFLIICILVAVLGGVITVSNIYPIYVFMLMFLAYNVSLRSIVKIFFWIKLPLMLLIIFLSSTGVIENIVLIDKIRGPRYAFGHIYATDFASAVFYLVLAYYYIRKKLGILDILLATLVIVSTYITTNARLSVYIMILATVLFLLLRTRLVKYLEMVISNIVMAFVFVISYVFTLMCSFLYTPENILLEKFNDILSGRLELGKKAFNKYNIEVFSQWFPMQGHGWAREKQWDPVVGYNYLDSIYMQWTFLGGAAITVIFLYLLTRSYEFAMKDNDMALMIILILLAISGIIDQHILNLSQNPFIFAMVPAILEIKKRQQIKEMS